MAYRGTDSDRRDVQSRWTVTAQLTMVTASQIGSHEGDHADTTFGRDRQGRLVIHGTNLAGALRSALNDRRGGYRKELSGRDDKDWAYRLFGSKDEHESPAIVFDSVAEKPVQAAIRDGVAIASATRTAADRHKYDREVALPGIVFPLRIDVVVTQSADEMALMMDLADALEALTDSLTGIRLGARKSRGLGQCMASEFRAVRYDLATEGGWRAYARSDWRDPTAGLPSFATAREAIGANIDLLDVSEDKRREARLEFDLRLRGSLIIRSPGTGPTDPDAIHLTENGASLLSGTSVAGALRAHAARIVRTLDVMGVLPRRHVEMVSKLFGPSPEEIRKGVPPQASRVLVQEATLSDSRAHRHTRVKIDRFTGGAMDTALFEEMPAVKGTVSLQVRLIDPALAEIGLMALVARDMLAGLVPLGGEAAVGRGVLTGSARLHVDGECSEIPSPKAAGDPDKLRPFVEALQKNGGTQP